MWGEGMGNGLKISSMNQIRELAEARAYGDALEILESCDIEATLNPQFLRVCGEIYMETDRFLESRRILLKAHKMAPEGNRIIYEMVRLNLKMGYYERAL